MNTACSIRVRGVVQGVGFRPFVLRLARQNSLGGWVANDAQGVEIFLEGAEVGMGAFVESLRRMPPPAAQITQLEITPASPLGLYDFQIRSSNVATSLSARISPDLAVCDACLRELAQPSDPRFGYPYINCTNCGPRYSVILSLPYDRAMTTMKGWPLDAFCAAQYENPANRRFHAQPVACPSCGPGYHLVIASETVAGSSESIRRAAQLLRQGSIVAIKGIGGYHLACDARNAAAVEALRSRKFRRERPFAVMVKDAATARSVAHVNRDSEQLLQSNARPITLLPAKGELPGVAPGNNEIGVMLPYAPLHLLLFAAGAPDVLVMTSGNRSSEPIAYQDEDALQRLSGVAEAFLVGERPIARRVDDSVVRAGVTGPSVLRRSRGYAPSAVAALPTDRTILAVGADLKNTVTLVVEGQAFVSQHIGDLEHFQSLSAFRETIDDLLAMYGASAKNLLIASDAHPQYHSTQHAIAMPSAELVRVQHHRAHIASVLAERGEWHKTVLGVCFDGTGYGDDGTIWGGETFRGSVASGFVRVAHLRPALLPGGDAAAQHPVQAAAGFLHQLSQLPDLFAAPFNFPQRYRGAVELLRTGTRCFSTTSGGRLFDCVAALLGFTRETTFEAQAAVWLEQIAARCAEVEAYEFPFVAGQLDFRPALRRIIEDRLDNRDVGQIARAFHAGLATGLRAALLVLSRTNPADEIDTVVASGGVLQNELLLGMLQSELKSHSLRLWSNHQVPTNDGGVSLGQAAMALFASRSGKTQQEISGAAL